VGGLYRPSLVPSGVLERRCIVLVRRRLCNVGGGWFWGFLEGTRLPHL